MQSDMHLLRGRHSKISAFVGVMNRMKTIDADPDRSHLTLGRRGCTLMLGDDEKPRKNQREVKDALRVENGLDSLISIGFSRFG